MSTVSEGLRRVALVHAPVTRAAKAAGSTNEDTSPRCAQSSAARLSSMGMQLRCRNSAVPDPFVVLRGKAKRAGYRANISRTAGRGRSFIKPTACTLTSICSQIPFLMAHISRARSMAQCHLRIGTYFSTAICMARGPGPLTIAESIRSIAIARPLRSIGLWQVPPGPLRWVLRCGRRGGSAWDLLPNTAKLVKRPR